jgi:hypothetical protein
MTFNPVLYGYLGGQFKRALLEMGESINAFSPAYIGCHTKDIDQVLPSDHKDPIQSNIPLAAEGATPYSLYRS